MQDRSLIIPILEFTESQLLKANKDENNNKWLWKTVLTLVFPNPLYYLEQYKHSNSYLKVKRENFMLSHSHAQVLLY